MKHFGVLVGAAVLLFLRKRAIFAPALYAEDGSVYLIEAFRDGLNSLLTRYAGYYQLLSRSVAYASTFLPVRFIPTAFLIYSSVLIFSVYYFFWISNLSRNHKFIFLTMFLLIPVEGEVYFNLTNSIWFCGLALFIMLNQVEPNCLRLRISSYFLMALFCLNGLACIFLAPLYILRAVFDQSRYRFITAGITLTCAAIQSYGMVSQNNQKFNSYSSILSWANVFTERIILKPFFNNTWFPWDLRDQPHIWIFLVLFLVQAVYISIKRRNFLIFSAVFFLTMILCATGMRLRDASSLTHTFNGDRYIFTPTILIAIILVEYLTVIRLKLWRNVIYFFCSAYILTGFKYFTFLQYADSKWVERSQCVGGKSQCNITIAPDGFQIHYDPSWKYLHSWQRH